MLTRNQLWLSLVACVGLAVAILSAVVLGGCATLDSACAKAMPAIMSGQALVDDAQTSRDQAEAVVAQIANPELRAKALAALAAVDAGLRAAAAGLHAASTACTTPDVSTIFADFAAAWRALAPFLALLGGPSAGSQVHEPLVMGMAQ